MMVTKTHTKNIPNDIVVIIPTYNESTNISTLLDKLSMAHEVFDILIVDDNSPDGTSKIVEENYVRNLKTIHLLKRDQKLGLGSAYRDGFKWALKKKYQHFVEMDGDFSHTFDDLMHMLTFKDKYDLIIGSRYIKGGKTEGWSKSRKLLSVVANLVARLLLGIKVNDMTSGFRIYSRDCLEDINYYDTKSNGYAFQIEMTLLACMNKKLIKEVPITFYERDLGESKMSKDIVLEAVKFLIFTKFKKIKNVK